jgi:RNA polymerase primary sigma factor
VNHHDTQKESLKKLADHRILTKEEEIKLARAVRSRNKERANHAVGELIRCNMRLVITIAKEFSFSEQDDLISEGALGLRAAALRFDPKFKAKFATYASWWIRQKMRRYIGNTHRTIRTPIHLESKIRQLQKIADEIQNITGSAPTTTDLSNATGIPEKRIEELLATHANTISLETPMGTDFTLADTIKDENTKTAHEITEERNYHQTIQTIMQKLPPREQEIMAARFGLEGAEPMTLEEVGKVFQVTRERIRQIQNKTLRRLRQHLEAQERYPQTAQSQPEENPSKQKTNTQSATQETKETPADKPTQNSPPKTTGPGGKAKKIARIIQKAKEQKAKVFLDAKTKQGKTKP